MKILLFGTGDYYNRYRKWFDGQDVLALLDNSEQKQHTFIDGTEVLPPEEGLKLKYDIIVILSFYFSQMKEQLVFMGVDQDRIYHFYDMHRLFVHAVSRRPVQFYCNEGENMALGETARPKILLMSHDMTLGGPGIALFHAAKILKRQGYAVVFGSMLDGPLRVVLDENDIPVIVDENLQISTMQETDWVNTFSLILCNTLNYHVFLSERDTSIPVIWWLHDARFFYDGVNRETIGRVSLNKLKAVSVGPVPAEAVREFLPEIECEELLYGVEDLGKRTVGGRRGGEKVLFVSVGFLEDIKGQDILIQAVKRLHKDILHQCQFYIVGYNETLFGERLRKECESVEEIIFTGSVSRAEIHELMDVSSVLICPSRQDSMPTVAAEAMMHSVPCIVSNATGTAAYIHDGEDGFVFSSGDVQMLAERIEWCVANKEKLQGMGKRARELYRKYFSIPAFEKRFMKIIHEVCRQ